MKLFRRSKEGFASGDAIPFYHDGVYHLFYLTSPPDTTRYPDRVRTTWQHARSADLVHWEELPPALVPGEEPQVDANGCWTGSAIYAEGKYHIFSYGYHISAEFPQTICHATSDDSIVWVKDEDSPYIVPDTRYYESIDWRDPYVFYNDEDACYWMLIAARRNEGPENRRGCVVLYKSQNLRTFEHYGVLYEPYHTNCPECPEMYRLGNFWYLSYSRFSERAQTLYRFSMSPYGPWRTPQFDGIDCRRFYAAKSLSDKEGHRFYFGWIHDREGASDEGWWQWGGDFAIPHEVKSAPDGNLYVSMPENIYHSFGAGFSADFRPHFGNTRSYGNKSVSINSIGSLSYGFFDLPAQKEFLFECNIVPSDCGDYFGITLKTDSDLDKGYLLAFDLAGQRVSLNKLPAPLDPFWATLSGKEQPLPEVDGPRVCEKTFPFGSGDTINVKIVVGKTTIEAFIDDMIAFSYRSYEPAEHEIGLFAQDSNVDFHNLSFQNLE